jgi:hypothetical protein
MFEFIYKWLTTKDEYGEVKSWNNEGIYCRALVRDDGKIISKIDCWEQSRLPSNTGRIIVRADGRYLVEPNKRFEIGENDVKCKL